MIMRNLAVLAGAAIAVPLVLAGTSYAQVTPDAVTTYCSPDGCLVNNGLYEQVTTDSSGTGWQLEGPQLETGSGTCYLAEDGYTAITDTCDESENSEEHIELKDVSGTPYFQIYDVGTGYCQAILSDGQLGNAKCADVVAQEFEMG